MTAKLARRSAAARKAWRSRKKMALARKIPAGQIYPKPIYTMLEMVELANEDMRHYRRALPNPFDEINH